MKKILLTTAAAAVLATSSAYAAEGDFYGRANVGFSKFSEVKTGGLKFKSQNTGFLGVAGGYYLMNNVRAELAIDRFFSPEHKHSKDKLKINSKAQITTLLVNTYVDLFDVSVAKIFAGAGVGIANTQVTSSMENETATTKQSIKLKKTANVFSYALHLGSSTEFAPGIYGELVYSYRDMGKPSKYKNKITGFTTPSIAHTSHNVAAGVRFDF